MSVKETGCNLKSIIIVGGGSAGWLTAAALSHKLDLKKTKVTLIESDSIGTIGVGEATIPPLRRFLEMLGMDERDFMTKTQATFKLGIRFDDWHHIGDSYIHPFGKTGVPYKNVEFYRYWDWARKLGVQSKYTDYCPAVAMCEKNKFVHENSAPQNSVISGASYAYHLDAGLMAKYLREFSEANGLARIEGHIDNVTKTLSGDIQSVQLKDGREISADFFIDCSGFKALLIDKHLDAGFENWNKYLFTDRAIAVQTENNGDILPYTISTAQRSGWTWKIPLQNRTGNGYVYSSAHSSDQSAMDNIVQKVEGELLTDPKVIPFNTGRRKEVWKRNCLSVGLSSGFIEPLESTAIHLVTKSIDMFLSLLPNQQHNPALIQEYNRLMAKEYEDIRDFVLLHYCVTARDDSQFWRDYQQLTLPTSLSDKIELFNSRGVIAYNPYDLFKQVSWYSVFEGMKVTPFNADPIASQLNFTEVKDLLNQLEKVIKKSVEPLPSHHDYIKKYLQR